MEEQNEISPLKETKMPKVKFKHILIAFFVVLGISVGYFLGKSSTGLAVTDINAPVMKCATEVGLNLNDFNSCVNSGVKEEIMQQDALLAMSYGVSYTPSFIFNCKYRLFEQTKEGFDEIITALKTDNMVSYINTVNERYNITAMRTQARTELTAKANENKTSLINRILEQGDAYTVEEAEEVLSKSIEYLVDLYVPSVEVPESESCGNGIIKVIEFGEFMCPGCYSIEPIVKEVMEENSDVSFDFHNVVVHQGEVEDQIIAGECAREQNKFDEFKTCIFNENFKE